MAAIFWSKTANLTPLTRPFVTETVRLDERVHTLKENAIAQ